MRNALCLKVAALAWIIALLAVAAPGTHAMERYYLTIYARNASQTDTPLDRYLQQIRARIEKNQRYPLAARKLGLEARVLVRFVIATDGGLEELELGESRGIRLLDEAALAAVRAAAPFPAPPEEFFPGAAAMQIVIAFALL